MSGRENYAKHNDGGYGVIKPKESVQGGFKKNIKV